MRRIQLKMPDNGVVQEDAWLNDAARVKACIALDTEPGTPGTVLSQAFWRNGEIISVGHRLWPVVLRLSERAWHEVYQITDVPSVEETVLVEFVRGRTIDYLREELALAKQIQDLAEAERILQSVVNEALGYGPLECLFHDISISEIRAMGPRYISIERHGKIEYRTALFADERHMLRIMKNMLRRAGQQLPSDWPMNSIRLPEGTQVIIVLPPLAAHGPTITIRL
jgi:glycine/D-amino acid oxidase-like deaminating enzyme